jgi:hypothetical protein
MGKRSSMRMAMNRRGISGKWKAIWHSSPWPKWAMASSGRWFASARIRRAAYLPSTCFRNSFRKACVSGRILAVGAIAFI